MFFNLETNSHVHGTYVREPVFVLLPEFLFRLRCTEKIKASDRRGRL